MPCLSTSHQYYLYPGYNGISPIQPFFATSCTFGPHLDCLQEQFERPWAKLASTELPWKGIWNELGVVAEGNTHPSAGRLKKPMKLSRP
jgi:hypothetical protein